MRGCPATAYCPRGFCPKYRQRWRLSRPCSGWERVGRRRSSHRTTSHRVHVTREDQAFWSQTSRTSSWRKTQGTYRASSAIRTARLKWSPTLHPRPIKVVVFNQPYPVLSGGRRHLGASFALRCLQRFSVPNVSFLAVPLAGQPAHRRFVRPGPLVLRTAPRTPPAPTMDRDRTVSRRSEPSSRAALMGEQPNPWDRLQPQDATSRHRGAKPCRRCELLGRISLLSPG